ncbi:MAG TPA: LD-carboxypeptidase [Terriglobales bacterium]|nr:LD-carboxypeptidase [Terriglobales bacterium]
MRKRGEPARVVPPVPSRDGTIGIVAPASNFEEARLIKGCRVLNKAGHKTFYFDSILEKELYFAGGHARRARELEDMFRRRDIEAILCARGGYGSNHLLPLLDMGIIRSHPKMFIGYSDITSLLTYFCDQADMVTYHGPMVVTDYAEVALTKINHEMRKLSRFENQLGELDFKQSRSKQPGPGSAEGVLYGGCLSMLAASLGTPYEIQTENTILFIEDINAKPYQIDRMLMQLKQAGKFKAVRGFIFGEMVGCIQPNGQDYSLGDVILSVLGELKVPIAFGLRSGHVSKPWNVTLPIGAAISLEVAEAQATLKGL